MKHKIYLIMILIVVALIFFFWPGHPPYEFLMKTLGIESSFQGTQGQSSERDDLGCFYSCSFFPEGSKQMCEDWKAGKDVQWPPDCKMMQYGPCIQLCEFKKKNSGNESSFQGTQGQSSERDDFGCFYSCSFFPEGPKQMCEDWKAGKNVIWPPDCKVMQYGPCITLCKFEKKNSGVQQDVPQDVTDLNYSQYSNYADKQKDTGIPEKDPDPDNAYIYILDIDPLNHRIVRIEDMTGKGRVSYGSRGSGVNQFDVKGRSPHFTIDSKGRIYIPDTLNDRIIRVDDLTGKGWVTYGTSGKTEGPDSPRIGKFIAPSAVRLDSQERIYILEQSLTRVVRIDDMTGKNWVALGKIGTNIKDRSPDSECGTNPPGSYHDDAAVNVFLYSKALDIDSQDRIYVSDTCNYRIVRFDDMTGKNWVSFGGKRGSGVGEFGDALNGIAVGPDGKIYIADEHNHRIVRIDDMTGKGWTVFGSEGSGVNQFNQPHDIAISKSGKIYVADTFYNDRIVRFDDMTGKGWIAYAPYVNAAPGANDLHLDVPKGIFIVERE